MQVRARLADVDDGGVREGMHADCVLDAYPEQVWKGTVRQVSPVARAEGREATRRFFDVVVTLDAAAPDLMRPGMSMRVEVMRRRAEDALWCRAWRCTAGRARPRCGSPAAARRPVEVEWCTELACVVRGGVLGGRGAAGPRARPARRPS